MSSSYARTRVAQFDEDVRWIMDVFNHFALLTEVKVWTVSNVKRSTTVQAQNEYPLQNTPVLENHVVRTALLHNTTNNVYPSLRCLEISFSGSSDTNHDSILYNTT